MKNLNKLFAFLAVVAISFSCVEDDDFAIPDLNEVVVEAPAGTANLTTIINQYENTFGGQDPEPITFDETDGFVEGYVVSSDEGGNYFKELVIQNAPENPTVGVNVQADLSPLFTRFNFGRKVYIKLDGLTLGESNGVYTLGIGEDLERIFASEVLNTILRDEETATIVPKQISLSEVSESLENQWVRVSNVQFLDSELGKTFATERGDTFDGDRLIQTCEDFFATPLVFQTSTFADFKSIRVPEGSGSIDGLILRDFRDEFFVLKANAPSNFDFDPTTRCEFDVVACGTANGPGANTLIDEDFNGGVNNTATMPAGWTNYVQAGTVQWESYFDGDRNSPATRATTFRSGDDSSIAWLITPQIDFDAQTGEVLNFFTSNDFADASTLEVLFSNDWDGTPAGVETATWSALADATVVPNSEFFRNFVSSGNVSLDCVDGTGAIAFKYTGNEADGGGNSGAANGGYQLDDVTITSN
ncbi:hypothetical protein AAU57_03310 [Nonlabens sp. YIK11]|uniref:DUF5689 domain-containing protein n=1 Tax=Nonlabens sp. YIK11 TaxID=1453349 RepID=UPI0007076233|nr:DUF5689 domain-containing protein [Nonlabens sp. YIK11]KQC34482.1 hypothetical protein AAU57_03310 [Nonlabens sp. YIK11]